MASIYSWESFIRIHGGDPGARDVFEKVMDALLRAENPDEEVHIVKASRGDGGIDVYVYHYGNLIQDLSQPIIKRILKVPIFLYLLTLPPY